MSKKMLMIDYIKQAKEFKFLGESLEETIVIRKVNDMNKKPIFQINYELLEFTLKDSEEFDNENNFINRIEELFDAGVRFNKYDYYNKTEAY